MFWLELGTNKTRPNLKWICPGYDGELPSPRYPLVHQNVYLAPGGKSPRHVAGSVLNAQWELSVPKSDPLAALSVTQRQSQTKGAVGVKSYQSSTSRIQMSLELP